MCPQTHRVAYTEVLGKMIRGIASLQRFRNPFPSSPASLHTCPALRGPVLSRVRLCPQTPWTVTHQAPLSMGFSRREYWSGLPFPTPGDLPHPGTELVSLVLQADSLPTEPLTLSHTGGPINIYKASVGMLFRFCGSL